MAANISANDLPADPDYDPRLDPSAGTLIPSPFLPYTHAIVAYPFNPCNIFKTRMFFLAEHRVGDRPAIVASQNFVVNEMRKLRDEEEEAQRVEAMPEVEVTERDTDINNREMWREKLGWAKAQEPALRRQWCHFYTFVTLSRLLVGYYDRYDWIHGKGRWERATGYDREYPRGTYVCRVLEWIDDVRYRIEDEWNAAHTAAKLEKKSGKRKRKSTPDDVIKAMKNAPRKRIAPANEASGQEQEVDLNDLNTHVSGAPAVIASQSPLQVQEPISGSIDHALDCDGSNKLLAEEATARPSSGFKEDHKQSAEVRRWLKPDSPEVADSIESNEYWDLPTSPANQKATGTDSNLLERTEIHSDPITISSDNEVAELPATKISIDLTINDDIDNAAITRAKMSPKAPKKQTQTTTSHTTRHPLSQPSSSCCCCCRRRSNPTIFFPRPPLPAGPTIATSYHPHHHRTQPRASRLAIEAGFGNYAFLNGLGDDDRRMWADFFGERRAAADALRNIANLYREPRSRGFTRRLIHKVAEQYPRFLDAQEGGDR